MQDSRSARMISVQVNGYRSCQITELSLHPDVTALIGINGAGKTNLLSAIRLLGNRLRGPSSRNSEDPITNDTTITTWFDVDGKKIGYRVRLQLSVSSRNTDEVVSMQDEWNLHSITKSRAWKSIPQSFFFQNELKTRIIQAKNSREYDLLARQLERYEYDLYRHTSKRQLIAFDDPILENKEIINCIQKVQNFYRKISYYSASQFTDPTRCPSSFEIESDYRLVDSYNTSKAHVKFLHDLYILRKENPDLYKTYEDLISKNELGLISKLNWKEVKLSSNIAEVKSGGEVKRVVKQKTLIIPKVQIGQSHITFNQLSEGTFKTLALLFYIMTDASTCTIIEEPEVCVHLGLLSKIISTIKSYSRSKQVIFSTHSDQVLDQLQPENIVIIEMTKAGTIASEMNKWLGPKGRQALTAYLEESGTLGEYWRSGGLSK